MRRRQISIGGGAVAPDPTRQPLSERPGLIAQHWRRPRCRRVLAHGEIRPAKDGPRRHHQRPTHAQQHQATIKAAGTLQAWGSAARRWTSLQRHQNASYIRAPPTLDVTTCAACNDRARLGNARSRRQEPRALPAKITSSSVSQTRPAAGGKEWQNGVAGEDMMCYNDQARPTRGLWGAREVARNLQARERIARAAARAGRSAEEVTVAVTKTVSVERIEAAIAVGATILARTTSRSPGETRRIHAPPPGTSSGTHRPIRQARPRGFNVIHTDSLRPLTPVAPCPGRPGRA